MTNPPVKPQKSSEVIADYLERQIKTGVYEPGTKLPTVVELAETFAVGRSTIREALSALKAIGYLDIRHGGGTYVNKTLPTEQKDPFAEAQSLREVIEVRKYIEVGCAALAAERRTEENLNQLQAILRQMEETLHDEQASEQADLLFHRLIAEAAQNTLLTQLMKSLNSRLAASIGEFRRRWFYNERASAVQLLSVHRAIYEAIEAQNEQLAAETMMQHLIKVESTLQKRM